jgi:putative salt-induced outer membrane protein YdiY
MSKRIITVLVVLMAAKILNAQIMNIEQDRIKTDTTGWAGTLEMSFQYIKNTKELINASSHIHLQYKTQRSLYLMLTNYSLAKSGSSNFADAGYLHLRYNYKFKPWLTAEIFTQIQYNNPLNIKLRGLTGAGPRFKVFKTKTFVLYYAMLYMYEHENVVKPDLTHKDHRMSTYISFTWKLKDNFSLINTCYYQPKISDFSDFRFASHTDMKIKISKHLAFKLSHIYTFDSDPAENIPKYTHALQNTLSFEF